MRTVTPVMPRTLNFAISGRSRLLAIALAALVAALSMQAVQASPGSGQTIDAMIASDDDLRVRPLTGRVLAWRNGQLRPVRGARVSSGIELTTTAADGSFRFGTVPEGSEISVINPGYEIATRSARSGAFAFVLEPVVVNGIFVPFHKAGDPSTRADILNLVDRGLINSVVLDIKDEGGQVAAIAATETVERIGANKEIEHLDTFLEELSDRGVYTIGRIVTFMDTWYSRSFPANALHFLDGRLFSDGGNSNWSSPFSAATRQYNIDIAVAAAEYFDEIQFDYVRLPYEDRLLERQTFGQEDRIAAITTFVRDAREAIHLAGAAVSADLFGVISVRHDNDQGIGQSLEQLAPHLDYVSPMLYPSGWSTGWFNLAYPPAHPGKVIRDSTDATIDLVASVSRAHVRPWLQDFPDYGYRGLHYGREEVTAQIEAARDAGANGFMLWDAALAYEVQSLKEAAELVWSPRAGR